MNKNLANKSFRIGHDLVDINMNPVITIRENYYPERGGCVAMQRSIVSFLLRDYDLFGSLLACLRNAKYFSAAGPTDRPTADKDATRSGY